VITLLSPSPDASRRAQELMGEIFGLQQVAQAEANYDQEDVLNQKFQSGMLAPRMTWDSVASQCPTSDTVLHWLSAGSSNSSARGGAFSLLGITAAPHPTAITETRTTLAAAFPASQWSLRMRHWLQRPLTAPMVLNQQYGLPVLELPSSSDTGTTNDSASAASVPQSTSSSSSSPRWKEIAFTMDDEAQYTDGSTVLSKLSDSGLTRPVTGLYEWPTSNSSSTKGLYVRPIPTAQVDFKGQFQSVVLTFQTPSVHDVLEQHRTSSTNNNNWQLQWHKIGFTGHRNGQLRLQATCTQNTTLQNILPGLDVRFCDTDQPSSVFNEAGEALLASSVDELQSPNVLKSKADPGIVDDKMGSADCWIEVRTMARNPGLYNKRPHKIATAPPSYPE
jgi:hypothetical protein